MTTQVEIARRVGLDVSSVNKILNRAPGAVWRKQTIALVFKVARQMGYDFNRDTKHSLRAEKKELLAALEDAYCKYFDLGGRDLKPETMMTMQKYFNRREKRSTA